MTRPPDLHAGAFRLDRRLGTGGTGEVWRAEHPDGTAVAVKLLTDAAWRNPRVTALVRDEARIVAGLDHPAVVALYDAGQVDAALAEASEGRFPVGSPWLAMELAPGGDLTRLPRSWAEARDVLVAVLDGLAHAHARGVLHRDLKPDNLLRWDGRAGAPPVKLSDFGLAAAIGAEGGLRAGTPRYMAPEQVRGDWRDLGPATDLYGTGCLAWTLVSGKPPFLGSVAEVLDGQMNRALPPLVPRFPIPDGLLPWLGWLLEKSPRARCERAADAAFGLASLEGVQPGPSAVTSVRPTATWTPSSFDLPEIPDDPDTGPAGSPADPPPFTVTPAEPHAAPRNLGLAGLGLFRLRVSRMVGREAEQATCWEILRSVVEGGGARAVLIRGPSGIGSRRLARWVAERAHELGQVDVLRSSGDLRGAIARHLGMTGLDPEAAGRRLTQLGWTGPPSPDAVATGLVGTSPPSGLAGVLRWLSLRRTLVVWIDAAHDDPVALSVGNELLGTAARVLVLATADASQLTGHAAQAWRAAQGSGAVEITLETLSSAASRKLVHDLLGLAPSVGAFVNERCGGNPGFAYDLVGTWVDSRALVPTADGFALAEGAPFLPAGRAEAWTARRAHLLEACPAARPALSLAAVLGPRVRIEIFEEVASILGITPPADFEDLLERFGVAQRHGDAWRFGDAPAAVADPAVHRACAAALAKGHDWAGVAAQLLAAGDAEQAVEPLARAAHAAFGRGDHALAEHRMGEWTRTVEALGWASDDPRLGFGLVRRARIHRASGRLEEAQADALHALALADLPGELRGFAAAELASLCQERSEPLERSAPWIDSAVADFLGCGQPERAAHLLLAAAYGFTMRHQPADAWTVTHRARALLGEKADNNVAYLRTAGMLLREAGDLEAAYAHIARAAAAIGDDGRSIHRANLENELAFVGSLLGRPDVEEHYRTSMALHDQIGGWRTILPRVNLAAWLVGAGRTADAARVLEEAEREVCFPRSRAIAPIVSAARAVICAGEADGPGFDAALAAAVGFVPAFALTRGDIADMLEFARTPAIAAGWTDRVSSLQAACARLRDG